MGRGGARRVLWGVVALLAAVIPARAVAAGHEPTDADAVAGVAVSGGVAADGTAVDLPVGWRIEHPAVGVYRVVLEAGAFEVFDVVRWNAVAVVTMKPAGGATEEVRFVEDGIPVDTAFSYTATVRR